LIGIIAIATCRADTLGPGEILRYTFTVDLSNPATSSCIGLCDALLIQSNLENPSGLPITFELFDGSTLLGDYTTSAAVNCCVLGGFAAIGTNFIPGFDSPPATQVDFTDFQSSTTSGVIDISVSGGSILTSDQTSVMITIGASLAPNSLDFFGTDPATFTGSELITPEPSGFLPVGMMVLVMIGRRWPRFAKGLRPSRLPGRSTRTSRRISCTE